MNELEIKIDGTSVSIDHGPQRLKNSLLFSLLLNPSPEKNIDNEISRIENDISLLEGMILLLNDKAKTIKILYESKDPNKGLRDIIAEYGIKEKQAVFFLNTSLKDLDKIDYKKLLEYLKRYILFLENLKDEPHVSKS